jgi:signal transduction histidine kinase
MPRTWVWLQLIIGWLPVWALYSTLIVTAHPGTPVNSAIFAGFRAIACAAALGLVVHRVTERLRWPTPMRGSFIAVQLVAAPLYAVSWYVATALFESALRSAHGYGAHLVASAPLVPFLVIGVWLYAMVASVSYATQAAERAAVAESLAAHSQLAALRSQINPHFLFNALHTVVQLIPHEPREASRAAEQLASLLRTSIEETRDVLPLADEWRFVQRYIELERTRFGDRLRVDAQLDDDALDALVPSFALQTLVENAVRHGAAPRVDTTTVFIRATVADDTLTVTVVDDGVGASLVESTSGTGLARLRDRVRGLCGDHGMLSLQSQPGQGYAATLTIPLRDGMRA